MEALFMKILEMSITAGYIIIGVLAVRWLLKKAPKKYSYLLWSVVGFRLACPVTVDTPFSLFNWKIFDGNAKRLETGNTIQYISEDVVNNPAVQKNAAELPVADTVINEARLDVVHAASGNSGDMWMTLAVSIWVVGILVLLVYSVVSYIKLQRRMERAILMEGNVYQSDQVRSPFILGFIRPRIYIPFGLEAEVQKYVLAHERYHLRRLDHIVKPLAFLLLTIHWFNPLCWLAFYLMSKDMEMSCDEKVLSQELDKKVYSVLLLSFASNRRFPAPGPLAFGETGIKGRIKNVLNWKKPAIWLKIVAVLLCVAAFVVLASDPDKRASEFSGKSYKVKDVVYESLFLSSLYDMRTSLTCTMTSDNVVMFKSWDISEEKWQEALDCDQYEMQLNEENFDKCFESYGSEVSSFGWRDEQDIVKELRENNQQTWKVVSFDESRIYYLLLQKDGTAYLAYGHFNQSVEGMQKLLKEDSDYLPENFSFLRVLEMTELEGVACVIGAPMMQTYYEAAYYPEGQWDFDYDELLAANVPGESTTLEFMVDWDCETLTVGEDYYETRGQSGVITRETYELKKNEKGTFTLEVAHRNKEEDETAIYYIVNGDDTYIIKVEFEAYSEEDMVTEVVVETSEQETGEEADVTSGAKEAAEDSQGEISPLYLAITQAILEHGRNDYTDNYFPCASYVILGSQQLSGTPVEGSTNHMEQVTVYAMALYQEYALVDGALQNEAGSHMPVALTFRIEDEDTYTLLEYWMPEDGSGYKASIEAKFPDDISWEQVDTQKYIQAQKQNTYARAVMHFGLDTDPVVGKLFEEIMSSPAQSGNPADYLAAHPLEYRELIYYRDYTLQYIFREFLKGGQTGLKGQLMQSVMSDLIEHEVQYGVQEEEPQKYFDEWVEVVKTFRDKKEYSEEFLKENMREAWLLLQMMDE